MRTRPSILPLVGFAALLVSARSPAAAEDVRLGEYVPSGVHFFVSAVPNEAAKKFSAPYEAAFAKLADSGIGQDIFELVTIEASDGEREFIRSKIKDALRTLRIPDWKAMGSREAAFAFRISIPIPEYVVLLRGEKGTADQRWSELHQMLEGLAAFAPDVLSVMRTDQNGAKVARLGAPQFPIGLSVASKNDVVVIATSDILLDSTLRLMDADDASGSIVESARYKASQAGLPPGTANTYFDLGGYIGFMRGLMGMAQGAAGFQPGGREQAIFELVTTVLDEISRLETLSSSERAKGRQHITDMRLALAQRDGPGFIEKLIAEQEPIRDFHRIVPKDAINFVVSSGIDPETIHDVALAFIKERVPDGEMVVQHLENVQQMIGFHLKNDLLSWIDGGFGCITLPGPTPGSSPECVFLLRVKDSDKARGFVRRVFGAVKGYAESRGQKMSLARTAEADFRELRIDALPWCRPVVGTPGDLLVFASSFDASRRVLETFRGRAPSIKEHPRFAELNVPDAPMTEVYYYDVEGALTSCANLLGTVGFVASMVPAERETRPVIKLGAILTKFAAFLRDVDLALYTAGWTRYDESRHEVNSRIVTRVKGR